MSLEVTAVSANNDKFNISERKVAFTTNFCNVPTHNNWKFKGIPMLALINFSFPLLLWMYKPSKSDYGERVNHLSST